MSKKRAKNESAEHTHLDCGKIEPGWAAEELASIDLNDLRLNARARKIAESMASHPTQPINQACGDWSKTKATYRFMANEKADPRKILVPHLKKND